MHTIASPATATALAGMSAVAAPVLLRAGECGWAGRGEDGGEAYEREEVGGAGSGRGAADMLLNEGWESQRRVALAGGGGSPLGERLVRRPERVAPGLELD